MPTRSPRNSQRGNFSRAGESLARIATALVNYPDYELDASAAGRLLSPVRHAQPSDLAPLEQNTNAALSWIGLGDALPHATAIAQRLITHLRNAGPLESEIEHRLPPGVSPPPCLEDRNND